MCVDDSDILYIIYVLLSGLELTKAPESVTAGAPHVEASLGTVPPKAKPAPAPASWLFFWGCGGIFFFCAVVLLLLFECNVCWWFWYFIFYLCIAFWIGANQGTWVCDCRRSSCWSISGHSAAKGKANASTSILAFLLGLWWYFFFFVQLCFFYCLNVMCVDDSDILYFIYVLRSGLELTKAPESVTAGAPRPAASPGTVRPKAKPMPAPASASWLFFWGCGGKIFFCAVVLLLLIECVLMYKVPWRSLEIIFEE